MHLGMDALGITIWHGTIFNLTNVKFPFLYIFAASQIFIQMGLFLSEVQLIF